MSEFDSFWALRKDVRWTDIPGYFRKKSRTSNEKVFVALIGTILLRLAPENIFNPSKIWIDMKLNAAKALEDVAAGPGAGEGKRKGGGQRAKKTGAAEEIQKTKTTTKLKGERVYDDVIKVRNRKDSLMTLLREMKTKEGRLVLMVELLKQAMDTSGKEAKRQKEMKAEMYDILWGLEAMGLDEFTAPVPEKKDLLAGKKKDSSVVYDDFSKVKKLVNKAREVMTAEKDMTKMQLVDMCDKLPTKFTFGFKLDQADQGPEVD